LVAGHREVSGIWLGYSRAKQYVRRFEVTPTERFNHLDTRLILRDGVIFTLETNPCFGYEGETEKERIGFNSTPVNNHINGKLSP